MRQRSAALTVLGLTTLLAAFPGAGTAAAAERAAAEIRSTDDGMQLSGDAALAMREVHEARLAIFNGMTDRARALVDAARTRFAAVRRDAHQYAMDTHAKTLARDDYVPFDATLAVAELRNGETSAAPPLRNLSGGDVPVAVASKRVPLQYAQREIQDAQRLVGAGKYYEANLALKALEDAVRIDSVATGVTAATGTPS
jgi:hypothetical protein